MLSNLLLALAAAVAPALAAPAGACSCAGGVVAGVCYPTLQGAFDAVAPGGTIEMGGKQVLTKQIFFNKSVNLVGVNCGKKATISANMNAGEGGMLEARGPGRLKISMSNVAFTREATSGPASAFHGGVLREKDQYGHDVKKPYSDTDGPTIDFTLRGCDFYGLLTKARGGSAVYIMVPGMVDIDGSNSFYDNTVARPPSERFGGGGTLWLADISTKSVINISATFRNNEHLFEHGLGGGIILEKVRGTVNIGGKFTNNRASDGGAIHVFRVEATGKLNIKGHFQDNQAIEYGWGSRGGAIRIQNILGAVVVDGTFLNNKALKSRGGVFAVNRFYSGGSMLIKGSYTGNFAATSGGVLDQIKGGGEYSYVFEQGATLTIDGSCIFKNNVAQERPKTSILNIAPLKETLSEDQWEGTTIVYEGVDEPGAK